VRESAAAAIKNQKQHKTCTGQSWYTVALSQNITGASAYLMRTASAMGMSRVLAAHE